MSECPECEGKGKVVLVGMMRWGTAFELTEICDKCGGTGDMETEKRRLAKIAYEAYCASTGWRSAITGDDLPPFDQTSEVVQVGWIAAANAVKDAIER